jgi:hypothetical protein
MLVSASRVCGTDCGSGQNGLQIVPGPWWQCWLEPASCQPAASAGHLCLCVRELSVTVLGVFFVQLTECCQVLGYFLVFELGCQSSPAGSRCVCGAIGDISNLQVQ